MNFPRSIGKYLVILTLVLATSPAFAGVFVSVAFAPPMLPVYAQPFCPDDGYIWVPGYWAYGPYGYYWVPGTWVLPPQIGLFWTPCYWGWGGNAFIFHSGYWGRHVGYYGGINYGYGYGGHGYGGGRWVGGHFSYNTAVNNVSSANVHSTYVDRTAIATGTRSKVSYNGGKGGLQAQPTAQERQFSSEQHFQPTSVQQAHIRAASQDRAQLASVNGGRPATLAAIRPQTYTRVAQQHAKAQPLTAQDKLKAAHAVSAKSSTHTSAVKAQKKAALPQRAPAKPRPQVHAASQSHPQAHAAPQYHPQAHAAPQYHPQAHTAPQSHPQAHATPQSHSNQSHR